MTDGLLLRPGAGRSIQGSSMILKVGAGQSEAWSAFEAVVPPGFDVGAHLQEIGELVRRPEPPDPAAIAEVRTRYDIQQLTPMVAGPPH